MYVTKLLNSVAHHVTYCVSVGVYRSPAAVYVQVMPQLEKALTSDAKVTNYTRTFKCALGQWHSQPCA